MNSTVDRVSTTTRMLITDVHESVHRSEIIGGSLMAVARFLMLMAVLCGVAWSYALWGSATSPLGHLLLPAILLAVLSLAARVLAHVFLRIMWRDKRVRRRRRNRNRRDGERITS